MEQRKDMMNNVHQIQTHEIKHKIKWNAVDISDATTAITVRLYFKHIWSLVSLNCTLDSKEKVVRLLYYFEPSHLHLDSCDAQSS